MRKIIKTAHTPNELLLVQEQIAAGLFRLKDRFTWIGDYYSHPIKEHLKVIYYNKCAFCEVKLTEHNADNQFTVEHYRPKTYYFWLGNEWTNLFPTCFRCNNLKGDYFPLMFERNRFVQNNAPFDAEGNLDRTLCNADCEPLLQEKPLFLHPEIDDTERYFEFNNSGKILIKTNLNGYENERARLMVSKLLNRPSLEEKRKILIENLKKDLEFSLSNLFLVIGDTSPTKNEIKLSLFPFFQKLFRQQTFEAEFSLLGLSMINYFEIFFLQEEYFTPDIKSLINFAFHLFIEENN